MALSKTTQDHDEIRQWAESRGAVPAEVASTETKDQTGILRLEFPNAPHANDSALKEISWDEFFEKFDASGLAMVYQDETADGEKSNFNRLVYPENATPSAKGSSSKKSAKKSTKATPAKAAAKKTAATKQGSKSSAKSASATKASGSKAPAKKAPAAKKPATASKPSAAAQKAPAKKSASKKTTGKR